METTCAGCAHCLDCLPVALTYELCDVTRRNQTHEPYQPWWPASIESPTLYFELKRRAMYHQLREQARLGPDGPHTPWRAPRTSTTESSFNALGMHRGFQQLSIRLPAARTNLTAADDLEFVGYAARSHQAPLSGSAAAQQQELQLGREAPHKRQGSPSKEHAVQPAAARQQRRQQQEKERRQEKMGFASLPPSMPSAPADNLQHPPLPVGVLCQWQQHYKPPAGWLGAAWPQPLWQHGGSNGWLSMQHQHSLAARDGGWVSNKLQPQMSCWAQASGCGPLQAATLTAC